MNLLTILTKFKKKKYFAIFFLFFVFLSNNPKNIFAAEYYNQRIENKSSYQDANFYVNRDTGWGSSDYIEYKSSDESKAFLGKAYYHKYYVYSKQLTVHNQTGNNANFFYWYGDKKDFKDKKAAPYTFHFSDSIKKITVGNWYGEGLLAETRVEHHYIFEFQEVYSYVNVYTERYTNKIRNYTEENITLKYYKKDSHIATWNINTNYEVYYWYDVYVNIVVLKEKPVGTLEGVSNNGFTNKNVKFNWNNNHIDYVKLNNKDYIKGTLITEIRQEIAQIIILLL